MDGRTEQQQAANNSVTPFNFVMFSFSSSSCTLLFLSCCHCKDIPDRCGGSLDTSSSSNIYFCVSPRAAGSCVSVPVSELRATEICILYHAVCLFSHSTSSKCHWEKCWKKTTVHSFIFILHFLLFYYDLYVIDLIQYKWKGHVLLLSFLRLQRHDSRWEPPKVEPHVASWSLAPLHSQPWPGVT